MPQKKSHNNQQNTKTYPPGGKIEYNPALSGKNKFQKNFRMILEKEVPEKLQTILEKIFLGGKS